MPERARRLHETLEALRDELAEGELDPALRRELHEASREIQRALEGADGAAPELETGFGARVRESLRRFEEAHPQLTFLTGRVADALAEMGI